MISSVIENSQASKLGIIPGSIVKSVNGKDPITLSKHNLENLFLFTNNPLYLVVSEDGRDKSLIIN